MIRYKVVTEERKSISCNFLRFGKEFGKYTKTYRKGKTVKAVPNTLGIFVFKRRSDAEKFKKNMGVMKAKILRVAVQGRGKTPKVIASYLEEKDINLFYNAREAFWTNSFPPFGTICYPAVKVLD